MEKKTGSLLFRFGIIFLIFTVITLMMCGAGIYLNQTAAYKARCEDTVKKIAARPEHLKISAALGCALYDPTADNGVENVFKRADKAMYARKKEMKAERTN